MNSGLEAELQAVFKKNRKAILERGYQEAMDDEKEQAARGDEWVIYGSAVFTAEYEGYELAVSFVDHELDAPSIALLAGRRLADGAIHRFFPAADGMA